MRDSAIQNKLQLSLFGSEPQESSSKSKAKSVASPSTPAPDDVQFHLYKKPKESLNTYTVQSNSSDSAHAAIQSTWLSFTAMTDAQRNQLLKGLISRCSSKQVDYICTLLNLKTVEETSLNHVC